MIGKKDGCFHDNNATSKIPSTVDDEHTSKVKHHSIQCDLNELCTR